MFRNYIVWFTLLITIVTVLCISCRSSGNDTIVPEKITCSRIVSFAPSATEMLFALSLGDSVVGVSDFCLYPPQAVLKPKIGGYTNPNYEMILRLKPTLAVLLKEQSNMQGFLNQKHIPYIMIDNGTMGSILSSMHNLGKICNRTYAADSIIQLIRCAVIPDSEVSVRPRVLLCVDRENPGGGTVASVYAAGKATFYNDLIEASGMTNAITDSFAAYPQLSTEGLLRLQPDMIIDIAMRSSPVSQQQVQADWLSLPMLSAVKFRSVYVVSGAYLTVPGPRIGAILKQFRTLRSEYCTKVFPRRF